MLRKSAKIKTLKGLTLTASAHCSVVKEVAYLLYVQGLTFNDFVFNSNYWFPRLQKMLHIPDSDMYDLMLFITKELETYDSYDRADLLRELTDSATIEQHE